MENENYASKIYIHMKEQNKRDAGKSKRIRWAEILSENNVQRRERNKNEEYK